MQVLKESAEQPPLFRDRSEFYSTLRERVDESLHNTDSTTGPGYRKAAILLSGFAVNLIAILTIGIPEVQVALFVPWGILHAAVGFNVFHESIHGSLARTRRGNRLLALLSCSLLGVSGYLWRHKHNVLHHRYPNVHGWDDDLETRDNLRLSPEQAWSIRYRFQHLYAPLLYAFTTLEWIFVKDFVQYFTLTMNRHQAVPRMSARDHLEFWFAKFMYFLIVIALPLSVMPVGYFLAGFLLLNLTLSITLASIFQLAHVTTACTFPEPDAHSRHLETDWAVHQMRTTANFCTSNPWLTWFAGGLNYQVEHHLFPQRNHAQYPAINRILISTARDFDVPYRSYDTYWKALAGHLQVLKVLNVPG